MTPHTHDRIVPGCYRCDLGKDEELTALRSESEDLHRDIYRLQKMLFDRDVTSCEDLCLEVCAGPCVGGEVGVG